MSKQRYIDTKFWDDSYIVDRDPIEKLLFLYLLTNPLTNISGIYEISLRRISFDTGIDKDMVLKILSRFEKDGKIKYSNGFVAIKNFIKYQKLNPKIEQGIKALLKQAPPELVEWVFKDNDSLSIDYDSLSIGYDSSSIDNDSLSIDYTKPLNYINSNSNFNSNSNRDSNSNSIVCSDNNTLSSNNNTLSQDRDSNIYTARSYKNSSKPTTKKSSTSSPEESKNQSVVIELPLNNGENFQITEEDINIWQNDFPNTDVLSELRKMHAWLDANPKKRKTKLGIKRFIVNWLSREQDKNKNSPQMQGKTRTLPDGTVVSDVAYKTWQNIKDWKPKEVESEG